jgi:hypothetical protein
LSAVLNGYGSWSFTLREEHTLRVFENRMLRKISGTKRKKQEAEENCIKRSFMICTRHQIIFSQSD